MKPGFIWSEIINTQYYYLSNSMTQELAGVTNMSGKSEPASQGIITYLMDTGGSDIDLTLPGDVRVGGSESDILNGFPEFQGVQLDGYAAFSGSGLLYAANVRDDGSHGYLIVRNDSPYYSSVSIICEDGLIREITYECLGTVRMDGIPWPEG